MSKIERDFRALIDDGGAFSRLENSAIAMREIFLRSNLSDIEFKTYGHGGTPGEYGNGLWPHLKQINLSGDSAPLFEALQKDSQYSISQGLGGKRDAISTRDAFPLEIELTREWAETATNLTLPDKAALLMYLSVCEAEFGKITVFADQYAAAKPHCARK